MALSVFGDHRRGFIRGALALTLSSASSGTLAAESDKTKAESTAKTFLQQLDAGDLGSTYDSSLAASMKTNITRKVFSQQLGFVRLQTGGPAESRLLVGSQDLDRLATGQTGTFYYVRFKVRFASATLFQDVYLEKTNDEWLVVGFFNLPVPPGG